MAGERADILFKAELDASGAITSLQAFKGEAGTASAQAGSAFGFLQSQWTKLVAGMAAYAGGRAVVGLFKEMVGASMEAQDASVRLDASFRATSYSAGVTADQVRLLSREMLDLGDVTDEQVQNAASLLATYKEVRGEGFMETIKVARDLAAVMRTDLASATQLLGKVQQDPIQGMTMMRRAGIVLTEVEKDLVKETVAHSDAAAGQAKILELVKSRVEGVADALARTLSGQLKATATQWGEIKEILGGIIVQGAGLPAVVGFWREFLTGVRKGMEGFGTEAQVWRDSLTLMSGPELRGMVTNIEAQIEALRASARETTKGTEAHDKYMAALRSTRAMLGDVTRELKAKTIAETAGNEAARHSKDLSEEQAKVLQKLLDAARPLQKAEAEYAETMKLLNQAKASGEITTKQYADAATYAARAMAEERKAAEQVKPALLDVTQAMRDFLALPQALPEQFNAAATIGYMTDVARGLEAASKAPMASLGDEMASVFGDAFKDGFLAVLEGDDLRDPLKAIFGGFAGMFAKAMGDNLEALLKGKPLTGEGGALEAGGLWTKEKGYNWNAIGMMAGGTLGAIGAARQNPWMGAAGAAATVASIPGIWANPPVAIIATIAAAVAGYFTTAGPTTERAIMGVRGGKGYVSEITGGVGKEEERAVAQQITQRYQTAVMSFRDALRKMDADLGKIPDVSLQFDQRTKSLQGAIDAFIKGTVPRAVFEAYKPALNDALVNLGIGADRIKEELQNFTKLDFDTAMAGFAKWIAALVDITDVTKLLLKTPEEMRAEVNRTMREGFLAGIDDALERAAELGADADMLFSKEQVANAEQLIALGKQQYDTTLNYIAQLEAVSKNIGQLVSGVLLGFEEKRAATGGPESLGAFYLRQLEALQARMAGATSAEQINEIMAQMAKYGQALGNLDLASIFGSGARTPWGEAVKGSQEWVEQYLRQQQAIGDALLKEWEQEAADRNAALAEVMEAQRAALIAATDAAGSLADTLPGVKDGLDDLNDAAAGVSNSLRGMRDQIDGLAAALAGLGGSEGSKGAQRYA